MKITIADIVAIIISILAVTALTFMIYDGMKDVFIECDEYEDIPYRYEGSFFGTNKMKTIEGNHDGYMKVCIKGTTVNDAFAVDSVQKEKEE